MAEAVFRCFFPGRVRLFGKTNGHSRESRAALRAQIRRAKTTFCFSVLICTPNTGCPVLGVHIIFAYFSVCTQNSISGAFDLFSNHAFQFLRDRCTICNTIIPEVRNAFTLLNGQITVDQKQSVGGYFQLFA